MGTQRVSAGAGARLVAAAGLHRGADPAAAALDGSSGSSGSRTGPVRAAWAAGSVSTEQAALIADAIDKLSPDIPAERVDRLQGDLIGYAHQMSYLQLKTICRHAVEVVDPDGADATLEQQLLDDEERALKSATFRYRRTGGEVFFSGRMPAAQFAMLLAALEALAAPRHTRPTPTPDKPDAESGPQPGPKTGAEPRRESESETESESGPERAAGDAGGAGRAGGAGAAGGVPGWDDGLRDLTLQERLGRALCALVEHLPTGDLPDRGGTSVGIVITLDYNTLQTGAGEAALDTGIAMSIGQLRRLACNARLIPAVLNGPSAVLDIGLARRLFTPYQRIALALRDRGCIWPGCDRPPASCEAHHITWWSRSGPTDIANGCLLCTHHHHLIHSRQGWAVRMAPDGIPEIIPPPSQDPTQTARRHERHKQRRQC